MTEKIIAKMFRAKGFRYVAQFKDTKGNLFGEPIYFRTAEEVGPFMRGYNLTMIWTKPIEEVIS